MDLERKLQNLSALFITHSRATGFPQMFRDWTKERMKTFICIDHPLHPAWGTKTVISYYKKGKLIKEFSIPRIGMIKIINYVLDTIISSIFSFFLIGEPVDLSFGANNLNTMSLLILKKLGKVKRVVYHTVDYTPYRFKNKVLNNIYHLIDRRCCYSSDMLWNSSARMNEGRFKNGVDKNKIAYTIITPDGSNFDHKKRLPISKIDRKKIVFLGHLREGMGLRFLLSAFIDVVRKVPDSKLLIIGGGPLLQELKNVVENLGILQKVEFTGFIKEHSRVDDYLKRGAIGVAPFEPVSNSIEYYSDVGKPKAYLAAGMPVIITKVPEIAQEIADRKAGIVVPYEKKAFAKTIVTLLRNNTLYQKYREHAITLSQRYIWENIFVDSLNKTLTYFI